ncbi:hypothetical protein GZH53_15565 [Flavihumibacter sp. R14]|nr:hypothetical protein [Flavihumibacter soli]
MRKLLVLLFALPLFAVAQNNNVISVDRYFPKADKVPQFEKALAAHAQKYHKGDTKWLVLSIETGPDAGGYQVVEGPKTWDSVDKRGDLGKAHMDDWNGSVQPFLSDRVSFSYMTFRADLSSVAQTDYAEKIAVNHVFYKPGYYDEMQESITTMKKVWEQSNQSIAVYESSSSGEPQFTVVTRYKQGLKERETGFREPFPVRYKKAHGQEGWDKYVAGVREMVTRQWSELLFVKSELGSK